MNSKISLSSVGAMAYVRVTLMFVIFALISGCGATTSSPSVIKPSSKFDDPSAPKRVLSKGNKVSSERWGAKAMMDINPFVEKSSDASNPVLLGLIAIMEVDANLERSKMWKYDPIRSLIFLADGERIELNIEEYNEESERLEWNSLTKEYFYRFRETGICKTTRPQYKKIMSATSLELKIVGGKKDEVFNAADIRPEFQAFLKDFYTTHVVD